MTKERYFALLNFWGAREKLLQVAIFLQNIAEGAVYAAYPLFLLYLIANENPFWIRSVLVCGTGFIAVSLARYFINASRPYEVYGAESPLKKDTRGKSMPSRHAFSAAVIAVNIGIVFQALGVAFFLLALLIAFLRVVLGVHFIKDVTVGIIIGTATGLIALI